VNSQAATAVSAWGGSLAPPRLISHRENAVFDVTLRNGTRAALRLHRPGYCSIAEIKSELWWTSALATAGFAVPSPIETQSGELIQHLENGQVATVLSWVNGQEIGHSGTPLPGSLSAQIALYKNLGGLLAQLHALSDGLALPREFTRRSWDAAGFLGPDPHWGRFWENPALDPKTQETLLKAREKAHEDLTQYLKEGADFGLIHADALRENVFRSGETLTLIDFDDSGFGFRLYDLTTALSQSLDEPNFEHLKEAILMGYSQTRPLHKKDTDRFHLFTMLRCFASLGWVVPRLEAEDSRIPIYVHRASQAAIKYLEAG